MINLNCHSIYSYGRSIAKIEDIARKAIELGEKTFCISDLDSFSSLKKASSIAEEFNLKLIPGYEAKIKPEFEFNKFSIENELVSLNRIVRLKRTSKEEKEEALLKINDLNKKLKIAKNFFTTTFVAKNQKGFSEIIDIYNSEKLYGDDYLVDFDSFNDRKFNHSIAILGLDSSVFYFFKNMNNIDDKNKFIEKINFYKEKFGNNLYFKIDTTFVDSQKALEDNNYLINLARENNIKFIISNDIRYVNKENRNDYRLYRNIVTGDIERYDSDNNYIMSEDEFLSYATNLGYSLSDLNEALENNRAIEESAENFKFPIAPALIDCEKQLRDLCEIGFNKLRKGTKYEEESRKRLEYELSVINEKNFSQYFIKVYNITKVAYENNILMGPGRGSAGGCEVCFLLGIIKIDPLKYGLSFERFLNPKRKNYPDIDLDFATIPLGAEMKNEESEENDHISASRNIIMEKLVKNDYFKFAHFISNEVNTSEITLFKNLVKYYEIPFSEANKITTSEKYKEKFAEKEYSGWLKEAVDDFGFYWEDYWDRVDKYMDFCYKYAKCPCNSSVAASGVIMGDKIPVLPLQDDAFKLNGEDLEKAGYIKFDLLSVNTLNQIAYFEGIDVDWNDTNDPKVWDLIDSGDTDFVFQFSSPGMKNIITETNPRNITDLAEINALYRPGPLNAGYVEKYIALKNGGSNLSNEELSKILNKEELVLYKLLKQFFGDNHPGILLFQEDIMKICQEGAGFSAAEADDIRKAMGKKKMEILNSYAPRFIDNWKYDCDSNSVWKAIVGFGQYAFNKSHSVAYAIIAYRTAKIWKYHKEKYLEYSLNYDTKKRYALAIDKLKELHYQYTYPTIENMQNSLFKVENSKLFLPGHATKNYNSYVEFLFSDPTETGENIYNLIYKGVCDNLTKDRYSLVELIDNCPKKMKELALYMEPKDEKFTNLKQILEGLKTIGCLDYKMNENNDIEVIIFKQRTKDLHIIFHKDLSSYNKLQNLKYDLKQFGSIRKEILSDEPYINTTAIERILNNIRERDKEAGVVSGNTYYKLKDKLSEYMREYYSNPMKNTFENVYAFFIESFQYSTSVKVVLEFNNKREIYYVYDKNLMGKFATINKKSLVKLTMKYSPFIKKKNLNFIYDFDILSIEEIGD